MVREVRAFTVTTTAGVTQANPTKTNMTFPARIVKRIEIDVPPGPNGNLGLGLAAGGNLVIPFGAAQFFFPNNCRLEFDLDGQIESGAWQLWSFNTGTNDHTVWVRFFLDLPSQGTLWVPAPPASGFLSGVG